VVLLHEVHGVDVEEAHVLADEEGDVADAVLVVEHEGLLHLVGEPLGVLGVAEFVETASVEGNGDASDGGDVDGGRRGLAVVLVVLVFVADSRICGSRSLFTSWP